jgi:N-acetylglucosamine-1-phosphodiester alpha-N-acetylglucosaminidase
MLFDIFASVKLKSSVHGHRFIRDCQPVRFGNLTHEQKVPHYSNGSKLDPVQLRHFIQQVGSSRTVYGHHVIISNPSLTVSVLEPNAAGGCQMHTRETVTETARLNNCTVAINAGFFNTSDGACLGQF